MTEDGWEVTDETGPSSLCSSPGGYSCRREFSLKISNEYSVVDGQVGRRLNQMHPIPVSCRYSSLFICYSDRYHVKNAFHIRFYLI